MITHEFDLPSFFMPSEPYWMDEIGMILISTDLTCPPQDYWQPKTLTKVLIYNPDIISIRNKIKDFCSFSNFLNQNYPLYTWIVSKSFSNVEKYQISIEDLQSYVNSVHKKTDWFQTIDYNEYPLLDLTRSPTKINFKEYFIKYHNIIKQEGLAFKIKKLIEFYAYNKCISTIHNNIYDNANLRISNSFLLIECLAKIELNSVNSEYEICPSCGYKKKVGKKTLQLIDEYIRLKTSEQKIIDLLKAILAEHYKVRNSFFHNAKYDDYGQKMSDMINKLGRNEFNIYDEIKYANASSHGLIIIDSIVRISLLDLLDECST